MQASLGLAYGTVSATGSAGRRGSSKLAIRRSLQPFSPAFVVARRGCGNRMQAYGTG
jgi:hypothetical protein